MVMKQTRARTEKLCYWCCGHVNGVNPLTRSTRQDMSRDWTFSAQSYDQQQPEEERERDTLLIQ